MAIVITCWKVEKMADDNEHRAVHSIALLLTCRIDQDEIVGDVDYLD